MRFQKLGKTKAKAVIGILLSLYSLNAGAVAGMLQEFRCTQDPAPKAGGEPVVQQRVNWAWKCYPDAMENFSFSKNAKENMWDFPQGKTMAYPVFGVSTNGNVTVMQAPVDGNAPCDALSKQVPTQRIRVVGFCGIGCLTPDQIVLFGEGPLEIGSPAAARQATVRTLQEGANLRDMRFKSTPLRQIVSDLELKQQTILRITTSSGNSIKVTENHPLVDGQGIVRRADQLKAGESLVLASGQTEEIVSIESSSIFGKVYNVRVESSKIEENIYVAQGYLSGSMGLQNEYVDYLNRKLLRQGDLIDFDGI